MNPTTVLDFINLFFAGILAGIEIVIHYGLRAPAEVLDEQSHKQIGQTTLRNMLSQSDLDELLARFNKIDQELQTRLDEHTERWGVKVTTVEIKDVELPGTMQRAMAKRAEAEREKRAKIIHAEGELQQAYSGGKIT